MVRNRPIDYFKIDYTFAVFVSAAILLIPFRFVFGWLLAVLVHECSHYAALRLCGVAVYGIRLQSIGVLMDTAPMTPKQEFLCAIAGPCGGLILLFFSNRLPCAAICAFIQSLYNLLPIFPMDGGRALRCILCRAFGQIQGQKISAAIHCTTCFAALGAAIYISYKLRIKLLTVFLVVVTGFLFMNRKLPCKQEKQIVQ